MYNGEPQREAVAKVSGARAAGDEAAVWAQP